MTEVGSFEAKTKLAALLERVERGETIIITRHGKPVAKFAPLDDGARGGRPFADILAEVRALRARTAPLGCSIRDLIAEGRRY